MKRLLVTLGLVVVLLAAVAWYFLKPGPRGRTPAQERAAAAGETTVEVTANLYFPGKNGFLYPEARTLTVRPGDPESRLRALAGAVLAGPTTEGLLRPWPEGVLVLDVFLSAEGVVTLDLGAEGRESPPSGGSRQEMAMVYSLVNTLAFDSPETRRVTLLWNGTQRESICGHLDATRPFAPRLQMLPPELRTAPSPP